jgi:DNA-binding HxlR family transcriptional regulator
MARCKYHARMAIRATGEPRSGCPINAAVEVIGDHWSLLILRDIIFADRRHFRVLQELSEEGIASNILADRLKRLVAAGLLTREDAGRGRRVTYSLTEPSIRLVPLMAELGKWGYTNRESGPTHRLRSEILNAGGPPLWEEFMADLRTLHLGAPPPPGDGPNATERMAAAYDKAVAEVE